MDGTHVWRNDNFTPKRIRASIPHPETRLLICRFGDL